MNKLVVIIGFALSVFIMSSCNQQSTQLDEATKKEWLTKGKQATKTLSAALLKQLSGQIKESGTVAAINYCNLNALAITDSISEVLGVKISRVSHRNRNPNNKANTYELTLIEDYSSKLAANKATTTTLYTEKTQNTFYAPIIMGIPTCLKCHGNTEADIEPEVLQVISKKYPADKATGFKMGELRGLFKVEFEK